MKHTPFVLFMFLSIALAQGGLAAPLATVNGKVISEADLQAMLSNLPFQQRELAKKDQNFRKKIVSELIDQELVLQEAISEKVESTKEFQDAMNVLRKQALINAVVSKKLATKITPQSIKEYYTKWKHNYSTDQVHAQHILLASEKDARDVLAEVKTPGVDFQRTAESRSKDPTVKSTRGDVGYFSRNMFDQAFTEAAFRTSVGQITGPVKTAFGYHVIKVIDRKVGKIQELAEVEAEVRADLQRELLASFVGQLRKKAKIEE